MGFFSRSRRPERDGGPGVESGTSCPTSVDDCRGTHNCLDGEFMVPEADEYEADDERYEIHKEALIGSIQAWHTSYVGARKLNASFRELVTEANSSLGVNRDQRRASGNGRDGYLNALAEYRNRALERMQQLFDGWREDEQRINFDDMPNYMLSIVDPCTMMDNMTSYRELLKRSLNDSDTNWIGAIVNIGGEKITPNPFQRVFIDEQLARIQLTFTLASNPGVLEDLFDPEILGHQTDDIQDFAALDILRGDQGSILLSFAKARQVQPKPDMTIAEYLAIGRCSQDARKQLAAMACGLHMAGYPECSRNTWGICERQANSYAGPLPPDIGADMGRLTKYLEQQRYRKLVDFAKTRQIVAIWQARAVLHPYVSARQDGTNLGSRNKKVRPVAGTMTNRDATEPTTAEVINRGPESIYIQLGTNVYLADGLSDVAKINSLVDKLMGDKMVAEHLKHYQQDKGLKAALRAALEKIVVAGCDISDIRIRSMVNKNDIALNDGGPVLRAYRLKPLPTGEGLASEVAKDTRIYYYAGGDSRFPIVVIKSILHKTTADKRVRRGATF